MTAAADVADLLLERSPALGAGRLLCIDGPAGSGKTTLATAVSDVLQDRGLSVSVVHLDDVYDGWTGLSGVGALVERQIVGPLRIGEPGKFRRYDWHTGRRAEERTVEPADVVILEGVGAGHPAYADAVTALVWVAAAAELCSARVLARDGTDVEPQLRQWQADEGRLFAEEHTRDRAAMIVDGA